MYELSLIAIGAVIGFGAAYFIIPDHPTPLRTDGEDNPDRRALFAALRRQNATATPRRGSSAP